MRYGSLLLVGALLLGTAARAQDDQPARAAAPAQSKPIPAVSVKAGDAQLIVVRAKGNPENAPTIVVVPGLGCLPQNYMELTKLLMDRGFNVALFESQGNEEMEAKVWDKKLAATVDALAAANADEKNALHGAIDMEHMGIIGHSLGGSVATLAAARDPRFKALVTFGPGGKDQSFLDEARKVTGATLAIDGSLDRITPPEKAGGVVAARSASPYRAHVIIKDGAHPNAPADFNADYIRDYMKIIPKPIPFWPFFTWTYEFPILKDIKPMPGPEQRKIAFSFLGPWLDRFVAGKEDRGGFTTGARGAAAEKNGILTASEFSDAARADGKPPSTAPRVRGPSKTRGMADLIERDLDRDRDKGR